jgi:hypothetical protein
VQIRSALAPHAATWYWPFGQDVEQAEHTRSAVAVHAALWYCPVGHVVEHTALEEPHPEASSIPTTSVAPRRTCLFRRFIVALPKCPRVAARPYHTRERDPVSDPGVSSREHLFYR